MQVNKISGTNFGARIKINKDIKYVNQILSGEASLATGSVSMASGVASGSDLSAYVLGENFAQSIQSNELINEFADIGDKLLKTTLNKGAYPYGGSLYSSLISTSGVGIYNKGSSKIVDAMKASRSKIPT